MFRLSFSLVACVLLYTPGRAQDDRHAEEINNQVWKPFIASYNNNDREGFKAVHSKDLTRVIQDDNKILDYEQYFQLLPDSAKKQWANWKKDIELRFTQRIACADRAFESGYYRTRSRNTESGESRISYGRFHVLLRKEDGAWKIVMDADTKEGAGEEVFNNAALME